MLQALRDFGNVKPGDKVLINGASGGVGGFAVQLARIMGAEVTGVCSFRKSDAVRSLGALEVIDYEKEDFTRTDKSYDVILAVNGHSRLHEYRRILKKGGRLVFVGGSSAGQLVSILAAAPLASLLFGRKIRSMVGKDRTEDMAYLASLVNDGTLSPMIERQYALEQTAEAFRYVEQGHAGGKVLIVQ